MYPFLTNRLDLVLSHAGKVPRRELAKMLDVNPNTLSRWCADNGISMKLSAETLSNNKALRKMKVK